MDNQESTSAREVTPSAARWICNENDLDFSSTKELSATPAILGQERAMEALKQGLEMEGRGYNIVVVGEPGTGRSTAVKAHVKRYGAAKPAPPDLCYVNNFQDPYMPMALTLPAGDGSKFMDDMDNLISSLRTKLPLLLESDKFAELRRGIIDELNEKEQSLQKEMQQKVQEASFAMVQVQMGPYTKPELVAVIEDQGVSISQLDKLVESKKITEERAAELREKYKELVIFMETSLKKNREIEREIQLALSRVAHELAEPLVHDQISDMQERHPGKAVCMYLDQVEAHILSRLSIFAKEEETKGEDRKRDNPFKEYTVNVVVDNSSLNGAPVIFETTPTYTNLFGLIEKTFDKSGEIRSDFTRIKPGSFLRANGGYLVLNARDVLSEPGVWNTLKRTLRNRKIEVHTFEPFFGSVGTTALKPESVMCNVKVVMIGDPELYHLVYNLDNEFREIFKIKAEFDSVMPRNSEGTRSYSIFIKNMVEDGSLLHFDTSGVAAMLEYGAREAGRRNKLSTRFGRLCDVVQEASYEAVQEKCDRVTREYVEKALDRRERRVSLIDEKLQEMIIEGLKYIDTDGTVVGQVNGLAVYSVGDHIFGKPARITARVGMGRNGIVSIEREVKLSGSTHDKGVLILTGFMRARYSTKWPLSLSATLCFEQSYAEVDGDSASSTEIYALLSAISGVPIRQDVAVTGSVDQMGRVQPVGGINEKIEGFFKICHERGLSGTQGVMIPASNVDDLMVSPKVAQAVAQGLFRIWAVENVDQGIEILTGMAAGEKDKDGDFEKGSINQLVTEELRSLAHRLKEFRQF